MKKPWQKKEIKDAKDFLGIRNSGSGNKWFRPGDSKSAKFLIESKSTEKKSYSISLEKWGKIAGEAIFMYRLPILSLKIQDLELVVLDKNDFLRLFPIKKR